MGNENGHVFENASGEEVLIGSAEGDSSCDKGNLVFPYLNFL